MATHLSYKSIIDAGYSHCQKHSRVLRMLQTPPPHRDTIDQDLVVQALADFSNVFAELKPYQQKELMRLVLHKAILGPDYLKIGLYGRPPEVRQLTEGEPRSQTFK